MPELVLFASLTTLATGLGAIPVFMLGSRAAELRPWLLGLAAGVMSVAAVAGLLLPALDDGGTLEVAAGLAAGIAFLLVARRLLSSPRADLSRVRGSRTSLLVFLVLLVHSLPEGFAIGSAYASSVEGLALFIIVAIGVQNIPEGTSVAIPMQAAGFSPAQQFWAAVGTSVPQPIGAVIAYLLVEAVESLLPISFAFAAGAMLALVFVELLPESLEEGRYAQAFWGIAIGGAGMLALSLLLGIE
jgi:zinc transporter, ZIP family